MKLLIISNMSHYLDAGRVVGWGPTVQEIDHLANIFDEIRHIGFLHADPPPLNALPYSSPKVHLVPVPPAGGEKLSDKLKILNLIPLYLRTILQELPWADAVHVRCPANLPLMAVVLLSLVPFPKYRWVKYAGNWRPNGRESWSYTIQRWMLQKNLHRGVVTVNGRWPQQPAHIFSFLNPSLTEEEASQPHPGPAKKFGPPYCLWGESRPARARDGFCRWPSSLRIRDLILSSIWWGMALRKLPGRNGPGCMDSMPGSLSMVGSPSRP